jgi:hypothetical protein
MFRGAQQRFALTVSTVMVNLAELCSPLVGSQLYTHFGYAMPFLFLACCGAVNICLLFVCDIFLLRKAIEDPDELARSEPLIPSGARSSPFEILASPLYLKAVFCIAPAACIKSLIEISLPVYTDGLSPRYVGFALSLLSIGFFFAAISTAAVLTWSSELIAHVLAGCAMALLALCSWFQFSYFSPTIDALHPGYALLLLVEGYFLGFTHQASAIFLGDLSDSFQSNAVVDACTSYWNTAWVCGISVGYALALVATYQDADSAWPAVVSVADGLLLVFAVAIVALGWKSRKGRSSNLLLEADREELQQGC